MGGSFTVNGIEVAWPRLLVKKISDAALREVEVDAVTSLLTEAFQR